MKVEFICGRCGEKSEGFPEHNEKTQEVRCPKCGEWQRFNGTLEMGGMPSG